MASLTAHLRSRDDHGRLAFHPECPLCRGERLAGTLPRQGLVSRRAEAALAVGALAVSSATPTAVLAADSDQDKQGVVAPEQVAAGTHTDPGFEPGGEPTDLPFDAAPAPSLPPSEDPVDDTGAIEQEPPTNDEPPVVDPGDATVTPGADEQEAPPANDPIPATPPPMAPEPPPIVPVAEAPPAPGTDADAPPRAQGRERKRSGEPRTRGSEPQTVPAAPAPAPIYAPAVTTAPPTVQPEPEPVAATTRGQTAQRGDRFHVVRRGESLWSIASDLLGDGASPARIAREVNRLWELNSARIGTGDPDLLMAETRLALR